MFLAITRESIVRFL